MTSITYRITGLMFLLIALTVFLLTYLANQQMTDIFQDYLNGLYLHIDGQFPNGGLPEREFLESVHQALAWVGAGIMVVGLAASYALARSITVPLRKLNSAVQEIARGNYGQRVDVCSNDEVQQLASAFNKMAQALEANNRLRKQLLADVAHELKTPLTVIRGNLEGMVEGVIETDREQLSSLYEETVQLTRLINDLRDLSLAEAGQLRLDKTPTDISQLISRVAGMLRPLAEEKKITLALEGDGLPLIMVDSGRINQVVYNLLTNAIRYTPEGGVVSVAATIAECPDKGYLLIRICDNGEGIAPEDLPYIFEHFYRADKSRNRKSGGSGIGLSIVKNLVELHGGRIKATSKLGGGSCFDVYLPFVTKQ